MLAVHKTAVGHKLVVNEIVRRSFAAKLLSEQSLTFPLGITVDNTRQAFHMHDAYATR